MKSFKEFFLLEYRKKRADGFLAPSPFEDNGKRDNRVKKKKLTTDLPYQTKLSAVNSVLNALELSDLDISDLTPGKRYDNVKNSKADVIIDIDAAGQPIGRVIRIAPDIPKIKPHLSMTK